jgi:hypothetical protein
MSQVPPFLAPFVYAKVERRYIPVTVEALQEGLDKWDGFLG